MSEKGLLSVIAVPSLLLSNGSMALIPPVAATVHSAVCVVPWLLLRPALLSAGEKRRSRNIAFTQRKSAQAV